MELFSDICMKCLNPQVRISKMVNEHTVDYHPSPSELTSRIHPLIYLWTAKGFIFSPEYFLNFHGVKIIRNLSQVLTITTSGRRKLPISSTQRFLCFFSAEREEDHGAEKITKIKLERVLVTSSDKFRQFCNHYFFGFCSVVP